MPKDFVSPCAWPWPPDIHMGWDSPSVTNPPETWMGKLLAPVPLIAAIHQVVRLPLNHTHETNIGLKDLSPPWAVRSEDHALPVQSVQTWELECC